MRTKWCQTESKSVCYHCEQLRSHHSKVGVWILGGAWSLMLQLCVGWPEVTVYCKKWLYPVIHEQLNHWSHSMVNFFSSSHTHMMYQRPCQTCRAESASKSEKSFHFNLSKTIKTGNVETCCLPVETLSHCTVVTLNEPQASQNNCECLQDKFMPPPQKHHWFNQPVYIGLKNVFKY